MTCRHLDLQAPNLAPHGRYLYNSPSIVSLFGSPLSFILLRTAMLVERIIDIASNATSTAMVCHDSHHCRTVPSIIFSCASTVFLCTWVALHPNVPAYPYDIAWWKMSRYTLERILLMLGALLAPEAIVIWAIIDWKESSEKLENIISK